MTTLSQEPIAILGAGCRFPGGISDLKTFWDALAARIDAITDIPAERWNLTRFHSGTKAARGKMYVSKGGFLNQPLDQMDAGFFGISPREAEALDPQQRLLLEVAWEAMENAGLDVHALAGSRTGVFVGGFTLDHMLSQMGAASREQIGQHTAVGSTMTMLSNRLSHAFDLRGPSITMDTACSSSLVAMNQACQALWAGQCTAALAGGVNVMLRPEMPIAMCKGGFLALDGHCKSFDARADGYARGEGAGIVVLKRLSDALRDNDPVLAVIHGIGVNQDGRTNGITVPNGASQEALMREVCASAGLDPSKVAYVEAHGTGTPVGDPIEAGAIGAVYGKGRSGAPCVLGSVKSNIGHLEAASGIAGVLKSVLCLMHNAIPPLGTLETPNPAIPFASLGLRLADTMLPLAEPGQPSVIGVNSFGYGGTNAHILLGTAPVRDHRVAPKRDCTTASVPLLPLSAESDPGLRALAQSYADLLAGADAPAIEDVIYSASARRTHLTQRLAVTGRDREDLLAKLRLFAEGAQGEGIHVGKVAAGADRKLAFVFTGMGPQWWAMGQELYQSEPMYRQAADEIDAVFQTVAGFSILAEMLRDEAESRITETQFAQPANFLLQVALTRLLASVGIVPDAIVGHSVGEVSAAHVAGVLSLRDAAMVSYHRSRLQKTAAGTGSMLAVGLSDHAAALLLDGYAGLVSVAAINSPSSVTLAGDAAALAEIARRLTADQVFNKLLDVEVPYHSPMMDRLREPLLQHLADLQPQLPSIPLYSTVSGERVTGADHDAEYWFANVRQPVFFAKAIQSMLADGFDAFIETGPHPVLSASLKEIFAEAQADARAIQTLRRNKPEASAVGAAVVAVYMAGARLDWSARCSSTRMVGLPNYPWQRETLWTEAADARIDRLAGTGATLLGQKIEGGSLPTWHAELNEHNVPYLPDHMIDDLVVVPAAAYLETFLQLHAETGGGEGAILRRVSFSQALISNAAERTTMRVEFDPDHRTARLASRKSTDGAAWMIHAEAAFYEHDAAVPTELDLASLRAELTEAVDPAELYAGLRQRGLNYGPRFQVVTALRRGAGQVLAQVNVTAPLADEPLDYRVHPTLLDGCFQAMIAAIDPAIAPSGFVPVGIDELRLNAALPARVWCYGRMVSASARFLVCDFDVCDQDGYVILRVHGLRCQAIAGSQRGADDAHLETRGYAYRWPEQAATGGAARVGAWLVIDADDERGANLAESLTQLGVVETLVAAPGTTVTETDGRIILSEPQRNAPPLLRILESLDGVVMLQEPEIGPGTADPVGLAAAERIVATLQGLFRLKSAAPRAYVVTESAHQVTAADWNVNPAAATLNGTVRVAFNELDSLRCTSIDAAAAAGADELAALAAELVGDYTEEEVALRPEGRFVSQLARTDLLAEPAMVPIDTANDEAFVLSDLSSRTGTPEFSQIDLPLPATGEIVVRVQAAAGTQRFLRAHDADAEGEAPRTLVVGEVLTQGPGGSPQPGALVCGYAQGRLSSHVALSASAAIEVAPTRLSDMRHSAAAMVSTLGLQAHALLAVRHARIGRGSVVLVQADRAGLAVIQACKARGATVIAMDDPAMPDAAWQFGADCVIAAGAEMGGAVDRLTQGAGVAVLAAPLADWTRKFDFAALTEGGCLLDTAAEPTTWRLPTGRSVGAVLSMVGSAAAPHQGKALQACLAQAARHLTSGVFQALPYGTVGAADLGSSAPDSAITFDQPGAEVIARRLGTLPVGPSGTYVVTGGFGGFGSEVARWLVQNGARHLALVGRRGAADAEARALVAELEAAGARVVALACDIGNAAELSAAFAGLATTMPAISGVIHSAAVLADAPFVELTPADFRRVMVPKALGAWNLHLLTESMPLDFFVLFSSISGLVGNSGQTNYAAANCYLDALAVYRRGLSLPGTSIEWGAIADVGLVSRSATLQKHLEYTGLIGMPVADALVALGRALAKDVTQICYAETNWQQWGRHEPMGGQSPRFAGLVGAKGSAEDQSGHAQFRQQLAELAAEDRPTVLAYAFAEIFGPELRIGADEIDIHKPFNRLGIDSLMAVELQLSIEAGIGVRVSSLELVGDSTIHELAMKCLPQLDLAPATSTPAFEAAA